MKVELYGKMSKRAVDALLKANGVDDGYHIDQETRKECFVVNGEHFQTRSALGYRLLDNFNFFLCQEVFSECDVEVLASSTDSRGYPMFKIV